jgi:hypothetical protein
MGSSVSVTATCTAAASGTTTITNTDSLKLRALQIAATKAAATMSGDTITGAINGAIGDAFSNGGNPFTVGPNEQRVKTRVSSLRLMSASTGGRQVTRVPTASRPAVCCSAI